jgi:hypothetical protein
VVAILQKGEKAIVLARNHDETWINIELSDGAKGWIFVRMIELVGETAVPEIPIALTIPPSPTPSPTETYTPIPTTPSSPGGGGGSSATPPPPTITPPPP